ncbi:hypothetical protein CQ018_08620 [Arthrobacter sp. MYb227]|uniref:putative quinol monooxygenase n=1 Tax=Arthrobacter sp. MYb227 TaxID=1848601 RepID=UPI000CFB1326|nr:hypothetical protein CQ018_08620 [Arthrobacter sp. MYb227]
MINVLVGSSVAAENLQEVLTVYGKLVATTIKEPGCVSYELLQLRDDPCELMLAERWLSQEHLDAHTRTAHFIEAMTKLETLETAAPAMIYTRAVSSTRLPGVVFIAGTERGGTASPTSTGYLLEASPTSECGPHSH